MKQIKEIGIFHSLTQVLTLGIYSGGVIFLLPLALAEITGWVMLGFWTGLNFLVLPIIISLLDKTLDRVNSSSAILRATKIFVTGLTGGLVGYCLYLIYYKFHMFYIKKEFNINEFYSDFYPIVLTLTVTISITEVIRIKRHINLKK